MHKNILRRVLTCVLSAGMVMSLGGVTALATEIDNTEISETSDEEISDLDDAEFSETGDEEISDLDVTELSETDEDEIMLLADELEAFAVYSDTDNSLTFYTDQTAPEEGSEYNDKAVTYVYEDVDSLDVSYTDVPWRNVRTNVPDVVIDPSFHKAQPISLANWFYGFSGDTFYGFENMDTSAVTDMSYMFAECTEITSVDVSDWNTSNVTDMGYMFSDCYSLTNVDVSSWDTSSVVYMRDLFNYCMNLESIDVSNWNTSNVTLMGYMFFYCLSLTDLDLSDWDVSGVTSMSNMFAACISLPSLDLSNWDTSSLLEIDNMFNSCEGLESVNVSGWNTSNVKTMDFLFCDCISLESLDVSDWDTSNVTGMCGVFEYCESLKSLDLSNWDVSNGNDMERMFEDCTSLESVDVSDWDTSTVRWMKEMFLDCEQLTSLDLSGWDTRNLKSYKDFATGCTALEWVGIGEETDIFTKAQVVDQQIWYDSPENGNIVSEDFLQDVTEAGQYWTFTQEVLPTVSDVKITASAETKTYDGTGITLTVTANVTPDNAEISYQWYKVEDGTETMIEGATSSQFTTGSEVSDSGTYKCVVTATYATLTAQDSDEITVTIKEKTDSGTSGTGTGGNPGNTGSSGSTGDKGGSGISGTGGTSGTGSMKTGDTNAGVWYLLVIIAAGAVIVSLGVRRRTVRK